MRTWGRKVHQSHSKGHISIVDDDEAIVYALTRLMRHNGYSAAGFTGVRDARIGIEHRAPDLLISDIAMPEVSGIDFAIEVTERFPKCKVLLFSARLDAQEMVEDMARHGYSFAVAMKPMDPRDLVKMVCKILTPPTSPQQSVQQPQKFAFPRPIHGV